MTAKSKWNRRSAIKAAGLGMAGVALSASIIAAERSLKKDKKPLKGQVAIVTGGARGIGLACALRLAAMGADIAICDIAQQIKTVKYPLATLEELANARLVVKKMGVKCKTYQVDIRDKVAVKDMMDNIQENWSRIDILVANAGIATMGSFESLFDDSWSDVVDVNLSGTANSIRWALPIMKKQNYGRIITVASQMGRRGNTNVSAYAASKWGIIGLTKSVALEVGKFNITCNCVCPTSTDTGMLNNNYILNMMNSENPTIEGLDEKLKSRAAIPTGVVSPDTVADFVELLAVSGSGHLSGTVMDVASNEAARGLG